LQLLIYVFDIESEDPEKDFDHFSGVLEAIEENSPDARIFVLVHKMDLVHQSEREMIFEDRRRIIEAHSRGLSLECFATSIWDETLYKAWSEVRLDKERSDSKSIIPPFYITNNVALVASLIADCHQFNTQHPAPQIPAR